jgi:quercetin dioxygenase-like cupin family protein
MENQNQVTDLIIKAENLQWVPFTLPGWTGNTTAAFPNTDTAKAPFIAMARLEPGAYIQKHYHVKAIEAVYVVGGELINNGEVLGQGSFMVHGPGVAHGPHTTEKGCTLMFIQYPGVSPDDSILL